MNTKRQSFPYYLLLFSLVIPALGARTALAQDTSQPVPLASETLNLASDMDVGLEIEARSPGAAWVRKGAEASAVSISVDGKQNQDLLLWAGEELFAYRVMLGRLAQGKHTVSVSLNPDRSAAGVRAPALRFCAGIGPCAIEASQGSRPVCHAAMRGAGFEHADAFASEPSPHSLRRGAAGNSPGIAADPLSPVVAFRKETGARLVSSTCSWKTSGRA